MTGLESFLFAGLVTAAVAAGKRILGITDDDNDDEPEKESQEVSDVHVVGEVLPDELLRPSIPPYPTYRPGEPLWQNHRLFEDLPRRQTPELLEDLMRRIQEQTTPTIDISRLSSSPFWQNSQPEEVTPLNLTPGIPPISNYTNRRSSQRREDPFRGNGTQGWTYSGGSRRRR